MLEREDLHRGINGSERREVFLEKELEVQFLVAEV